MSNKKEKMQPVPKDEFGFRIGTKRRLAAKMLKEGATKGEILQKTHLTKNTLTQTIYQLRQQGYVITKKVVWTLSKED